MTNGDKIRSMSNAELEEFIHYRTNCGCCNFKYRGDTCFKKTLQGRNNRMAGKRVYGK